MREAAPGGRTPVRLVTDMGFGTGKFWLLILAGQGGVFSHLFGLDALASLSILFIGGVVCWTRRIYFNPATGGFYEESGWPWLRLASGRQAGAARDFDLVLRCVVRDQRGGGDRILLWLEGRQTFSLVEGRAGSEAVSRAKAAAVALLLGFPLEERPGRRPSEQEMRLWVERARRDEAATSRVRAACTSIVVGNAVAIAGVLFAGWSPTSVFALFWLDLCVITLFGALRIAAADPDWGVYHRVAHWCKVLLTGGGMAIAAGVAGYAMLFGLKLPEPPAITLGGRALPALLAVVAQGLREGGVWAVSAMLAAAHLFEFATDLRRGASATQPQAARLIGVVIARMCFTIIVAWIAASVVVVASGVGPGLFLALLLAARGWFEVWAFLRLNAPLHLSGDLELMRAACGNVRPAAK